MAVISPQEEERERRLRAELVAAASHDIGVFCLGFSGACFVASVILYGRDETWAAITECACGASFILAGAIQYLGPRLFGP